jgi:hypothetical protein
MGRIELVGTPERLDALGPNVYGAWTDVCTVSRDRGPLADALRWRLRAGSLDRRR